MSSEQNAPEVQMYQGPPSPPAQMDGQMDQNRTPQMDQNGPADAHSIQHGMGQSKSSRRRRRKRKNKSPDALQQGAQFAGQNTPGQFVGDLQAGEQILASGGQPQNFQAGEPQQQSGAGPSTKRWKKKFRDRDRPRTQDNLGNQASPGLGNGAGYRDSNSHQPGNGGSFKRKGKQQRGPRSFVGPMDHSYRAVNGNFADASHHMTSATDPRGNVYMQNAYDSATPSRVILQTNARGFQTSFAYNTAALWTTTITDPLGNATQNVYDTGQRLVSIVNAQGGATGYTYYSNNLKQATTDALGNTTFYSYDGNGNLLTSTDASGNATTFTYDANNNLLSVTDPLSHQTTFTYDTKGNLLTAQDAAGDTTTNTYDSSGLLLTTTDARNFATAYQYDSYGNRTQVTDALSDVTQMTYDAVGHLLTTKNALGKIWTRGYDADDRLLTATRPAAQWRFSAVQATMVRPASRAM